MKVDGECDGCVWSIGYGNENLRRWYMRGGWWWVILTSSLRALASSALADALKQADVPYIYTKAHVAEPDVGKA